MCFLCKNNKIKNKIEIGVIEDKNMNDKDKIAWLQSYYQKHNLPIQEINLIGIRNTADIDKDVINDYLGYWTKDKIFLCLGTTDPSVYYTKNTVDRNKAGTAHLDYGWHEKIWRIGTHKGYEALTNTWDSNPEFCCKPTRFWRDTDFNFIRDSWDIELRDWIGINFHRMHETLIVKVIGKYSAGCQVVQDVKNFRHIIDTFKSTDMYKKQNKVNFNYMMFTIDQMPKDFVA